MVIPDKNAPPPLAASDVERFYGITHRTLLHWVAAGLPHVRMPGGRLKFERHAVADWLEAQPKGAAAAEEAVA